MIAFGIASVALLAYLDWITHRELASIILIGGIAGALILFWDRIVEAANLRSTIDQIPAMIRPVIAAVPPVVYFLARGQGTSGAGGIVLVAILLVVGATVVLGPTIDQRLSGFYSARNRLLPLPVRLGLALALPTVIAFMVVHGNLADLPAMFGGTTKTPAVPAGRSGLFFLGTLLAAATGFLLVRDVPRQATESTQVRAGSASPMPPPSTATHVVPAAGMAAWATPDPATQVVANLDPGLPLRIVETVGDWARVEAENGWIGWVDRRLLEPR
jgi:hypothetical protein